MYRHYTRLAIGTPPQSHPFIVDTWSTFMYDPYEDGDATDGTNQQV